MMFENLKAVRHANKQARKLAQLANKPKDRKANRLQRELAHVRAEIENEVMAAEDDDSENRFSMR